MLKILTPSKMKILAILMRIEKDYRPLHASTKAMALVIRMNLSGKTDQRLHLGRPAATRGSRAAAKLNGAHKHQQFRLAKV